MPDEIGDFGIVVAGSFVLRCVVIGSVESMELLTRDLAAERSGNENDAWVDACASLVPIVVRRAERRARQDFRGFRRLLVLDHGCSPVDAYTGRQTQVREAKKRDHFAKAEKDGDGR